MSGPNPACPCGSGARYAACCRPFHRGAEPPSAQALMRSRFSAFAQGEVEYLWRTLHPDHPDRHRDRADFVAEVRKSRQVLRYARLRVLEAEEAPGAAGARVLFHAELYERGKDRSFLELSSFARTEEGWRYLGGEGRALRADAPGLEGLRIATAGL